MENKKILDDGLIKFLKERFSKDRNLERMNLVFADGNGNETGKVLTAIRSGKDDFIIEG